jgi:hypothetical protein
MKLRLYLNHGFFTILPEKQTPGDGLVLVAERDPDTPIEFKPGLAYFNPLLQGKEGLQVFLANAENLIGYRSGKPPTRRSKTVSEQQTRGWFELPRENIHYPEDLDSELRSMIERSPALTGVIAQKLRSNLGLAVPHDLKVTTTDQWISWLQGQSVPLRPSLRQAFNALYTLPGNLTFSEVNRIYMLTGVEPEPQWQVLIRWVELKQVRSVSQQLFESPEWKLAVPETVLMQGSEVVLAYANQHLVKHWATVDSYPTGENRMDDATTQTILTGPIIYFRPEYSEKYGLLAAPKNWDETNIQSITEILNQAIRNNE